MKLISLSIVMHACQLIKSGRFSGEEFDDYGLTTVEIIEKYGYPAETHQTVTEDGYILVLHRIPHGRNYTEPGFPVLLAQPLFLDSASYIINGKKSLGFFLADEGFDVWMTNFRGTHYTKTHKHLSSKDSKFWDFSLHEFGVYDLPAHIDYICNCTKNDDLLFLGFSMGATAFFIMASERPKYQDKIRGAALLAPVATLKHSTAPIQFIFVPLMKIIWLLSKPHLFVVDAQDSDIILKFLKFVCDLTKINRRLCKYGAFVINGLDPEGFEERTIPNLVSHFSSTSSKVLEHYAQEFSTRKFRKFDYRSAIKMALHRRPRPPAYHLESITTPMSLFLGMNDVFATPDNVFEAFKGVRSVKSVYVVPQPSFTHIDFLVGKYVGKIVYPEIVRRLKDFISDDEVSGP